MEYPSYKQLIQKYLAKRREGDSRFRNFVLAETLKIEPSYLSRFLSDPKVHFSDELLFPLLKELHLDHQTIDLIITLKDYERCVHPDRKNFLRERLAYLKVRSLRQEFDRLQTKLKETLEILSPKDL